MPAVAGPDGARAAALARARAAEAAGAGARPAWCAAGVCEDASDLSVVDAAEFVVRWRRWRWGDGGQPDDRILGKLARPVERVGLMGGGRVGVGQGPVGVVVTRKMRSLRSSDRLPSVFERVPGEVLDMVLGYLGKRDMVAVGLCSGFLCRHVLQYIETDLRKADAPLAGTEIACTGTYLKDLPEPFERDELALGALNRDELYGGNMCLARQINWTAVSTFEEIGANQGLAVWLDVFRTFQGKKGRKNKGRYKNLDRILTNWNASLFPVRCPEGQSWVLRNLTTKEIVRLRRTGQDNAEVVVDDESIKWCRLDDVLLMRICWTMSMDTGLHVPMCGQGNPRTSIDVGQGEWAGHCFDVVMMELKSLQEIGWTDVTSKIATEAKMVRSAFPSA